MGNVSSPNLNAAKGRPWKPDVLFAALDEPARRHIILTLARVGATTRKNLNPGGYKRHNVSKHLSVLCKAGMVVRKENQADLRQCLYALAPNVVVTVNGKVRTIDFGQCMFRVPVSKA